MPASKASLTLVPRLLALVALAGCAHAPLGEALLAPGPVAGQAERLALYGRLIGEWDVLVTVYNEDGTVTRGQGEWIFGWVLEGRAIQDTWIVPARSARDPATRTPGPYGTTVRFPEGDSGRWHVVWMNPVRGVVERMSARREGDDIVQEGRDADGQAFRWVFHAIEAARFRWRSEEKAADGRWRMNQEMVVTRRR